MIDKIQKVLRYVARILRRKTSQRRFLADVSNSVPSNLVDVLMYSFDSKVADSERKLGVMIEGFRDEVKSQHREEKVQTFASPHSGVSLTDEAGNVMPGDAVLSENAGFARTGTKVTEGIQLKRIAEAVAARRILELGTNTGLSGCYFLSSRYRPFLHSVEGSRQLCQIAESNLEQISSNFHVANSFFDDELTLLRNSGEKFDLAFIDGQHEEHATIYYANAIKPLLSTGGAILFDDIFWSEGMYRAWCVARDDKDYAITLELGGRGLCILPANPLCGESIALNLSDYIGRPSFTRRGW